jgi:hypothetical protein
LAKALTRQAAVGLPIALLKRDQWAWLKDENGKRMLAYPIYSDRAIADGEPFLWKYDHAAAS